MWLAKTVEGAVFFVDPTLMRVKRQTGDGVPQHMDGVWRGFLHATRPVAGERMLVVFAPDGVPEFESTVWTQVLVSGRIAQVREV